jgi:hypothetical protein
MLSIVMAASSAFGQQSFGENFFAHNSAMTAVQPAFITPLVTPDPRLGQFVKLSLANQYTPAGTQTVSFGNNRGVGLIGATRFEFDINPPPYIQHNSAAMDGFGDFSTLVKYRIVSGNAQHGNFIVTGILNRTFPTGSYKNGALTSCWGPTLAAAKAYKKIGVISTLGGTLPTGKVAAQGRSIMWNSVFEAHVARPLWLSAENNSTYFFSGPRDSKMQNFVTPTAFYVLRRKEWKPTHPFLIFGAGMQIATSHFHACNHNLISEMRILF